MVSVITWQTIYLNGIIHSFDLAKANMHVAEVGDAHGDQVGHKAVRPDGDEHGV